MRFKCDVPLCFDANGKDERTLQTYGARLGIVGCMPMLVGADTSHLEEDYAERTRGDVVTLLRRMLTPLGDETDDDAVNQVLLKVRGVCVDGQLLKTAQVMQKSAFPNIVIIMRDPAHIIRISCRDPLHDAHAFSEQYDRLFNRRHALLKEFQNSMNSARKSCPPGPRSKSFSGTCLDTKALIKQRQSQTRRATNGA